MNAENPTTVAASVAIWPAMKVVRGTAVSYVIHINGHSLRVASACIVPTTRPHTAAWRHRT